MKWQGSSQNNSIHKFVEKEHMPRYFFVFIEYTERSSRTLYDIIVTLLWLNTQFVYNIGSSTSWEENTCLKIGLRNYVNNANYWKSVKKKHLRLFWISLKIRSFVKPANTVPCEVFDHLVCTYKIPWLPVASSLIIVLFKYFS